MPIDKSAAEAYDGALMDFWLDITDDERDLFGEEAIIQSWKQPSVLSQGASFRDQLAHLRSAYVPDTKGFIPGFDEVFQARRGGNGTPLIVNVNRVLAPPDVDVVGIANLGPENTYAHDNFFCNMGRLLVERVERYEDPSHAVIRSAVREATFHEAEDINNALRQARSVL